MIQDISILTFMYHEAVDSPTDSGFQRSSALPYKHGVQEFKDNVDIIRANSEEIVTIKNLEQSTSAKVTLITFDDGGKSNLLMADYLDEYGIKGHFFITTQLIGDSYFMNEIEIRDLHDRGHIIGSHSHTHPNVFRGLSYQEMIKEWEESKHRLEDILQTPILCCSIPGGDANEEAYKAAAASGFTYIFDSEPTLKLRSMSGSYILGRVCPKKGTDYAFIKKLSLHKGVLRMKAIRELKKTAKKVFFPIYKSIRSQSTHKQA